MSFYNLEDIDFQIFSSPSCMELSGLYSYTDLNTSLYAASHFDSIAFVSKSDDMMVRIYFENLSKEYTINLKNLSKKKDDNKILFFFKKLFALILKEYDLRGFFCYIHSNIKEEFLLGFLESFEILIAKIAISLAGEEKVGPTKLANLTWEAKKSVNALNSSFLQYLICAYGGVVFYDFKKEGVSKIEHLDITFSKLGHTLCMFYLGEDESYFKKDISSFKDDITKVISFFKKDSILDLDEHEFFDSAKDVIQNISLKSYLRIKFFFEEKERVLNLFKALKSRNIRAYFNVLNESFISSALLLQNIFAGKNLNLNFPFVSSTINSMFDINNLSGAKRLYKEGIGGSMQIYLPNSIFDFFKTYIENIFGEDTVFKMRIREKGVCRIFSEF